MYLRMITQVVAMSDTTPLTKPKKAKGAEQSAEKEQRAKDKQAKIDKERLAAEKQAGKERLAKEQAGREQLAEKEERDKADKLAEKKRRRTDTVVDVEPRASELEDIAKLRFSGKAVREGHDFSSDATVPQEVAKVLESLSQRSTAEVASGLIVYSAAVCRMCRLCR